MGNTETTTMSSMIAAAEENADISKTEEVSDSLLDKLLSVGRTTEQPKKSSDWKTYSNMWMRPKPGGDSYSSSAQLAVLNPSGTLTLTTYHPDEKKQMILHVPISKSQLNLILKEVNPSVKQQKWSRSKKEPLFLLHRLLIATVGCLRKLYFRYMHRNTLRR